MNYLKAGIWAGALLIISKESAAETVQYHPNSPVYIGGNFDPSYPGRAYPECLVRTTVRAESLIPGQKPGTAAATQFQLTRITTRKEMYRLLNVSMSLSGSYGFFSADASGSLEQENTFGEETFTWIIQGFSHFGKYILEKQDLNPRALALQSNPVGFRTTCGTDYAQIMIPAVQATALFTIRNLAESERKVLEASFNASYGGSALSLNAGGKYSEFIKKAAQFGQVEVRVHALGGPGISALSPIITNLDKPDTILQTIAGYFSSLTLDQAVPISYQTGSLQSLIQRPNIETDIYNRYIADVFEVWESLGADRNRLLKIANNSEDWAVTADQLDKIRVEMARIDELRRGALKAATDCRAAYTNTGASSNFRRQECSDAGEPFTKYSRNADFAKLAPKPYYLRYFVTNELIPNEEVINFTVRAPKLKNVSLVKKLAPNGGSFETINSVQVHTDADGGRNAGTSVTMKSIPDVELPIGLRIEMDSGNVYFEKFAFTRAPQVGGDNLFSAVISLDKSEFLKALQKGQTLPEQYIDDGNRK